MTATTIDETPAERRDGVSFTRLLWVAPLTVVVALVVNLIIKTLFRRSIRPWPRWASWDDP